MEKMDDKCLFALGLNYLVIDKKLPQRVLSFAITSCQDIIPAPTFSSKYDTIESKKTKQNGDCL